MKSWIGTVVFVALVVGGGLIIGYLTAPGVWYQSLAKPSFNPPGWVFGPVWTLLYVCIGIAGWRVSQNPAVAGARKLWWTQLALNFAWSPAFFVAHQIAFALAIIIMLLVTILAFIAITWRYDRIAATLFAPYAAWVGFASVLNASLLWLN